jgi:hypothetical protein
MAPPLEFHSAGQGYQTALFLLLELLKFTLTLKNLESLWLLLRTGSACQSFQKLRTAPGGTKTGIY